MKRIVPGSLRAAVWTLILATCSLPAYGQPPNPDLLWTNSAITNWITVVNKNTGALVRELNRPGKGNGLGIAVVGNTVFYTVKDQNVYMLDKNTGAELGVAFSIPASIKLSAIAFDGRNFWVRDYEESPKAFYVTPAGTVLKTLTITNCGFECDALEYFDGKLIANRAFETTPNYYDIYDTNGNLLQPAFITTSTHPGRSIAYDGTSFYVTNWNEIFVYSGSTGQLLRSMRPTGTFQDYVNYRDISFEYAQALPATSVTRGDFDGDGRADIATYQRGNGVSYHPGTGDWHVLNSAANYTTDSTFRWGTAADLPAPGDYDGDGRTDVAIYRPTTGVWWILKSSSNFSSYATYRWGNPTDVPVPADYDGDGRTDVAVYRPATASWWLLLSSTNFAGYLTYQWGEATDVPMPRDFDGDRKADLTIYRPSTGGWYSLLSGSGFRDATVKQWGAAGDVPVAGDYDGDGKADLAVYRPSTGFWWLLPSATNAYYATKWGGDSTDVPVPSDYDGDGRLDPAIFRPSTGLSYLLRSSTGAGAAY